MSLASLNCLMAEGKAFNSSLALQAESAGAAGLNNTLICHSEISPGLYVP